MPLDVALDLLPADSVAHYAWGQHRIWLAPEAAPERTDFVMRAIAQIIASKAKWPNATAFRAFVSICHEFAHYQQDIGTGCGHWDHQARRNFLQDVFTQARDHSWFPATPLPLAPVVAQNVVDRYAAASVFNFYRGREPCAMKSIRAELLKSPAYVEGAEERFSVPNLFELDAVLAVKRVVETLKTDARGRKLADANLNLFSPLKMAEKYRGPYEFFLVYFQELLGLHQSTPKDKDVEFLLSVIDTCVPVLLDIAFAYPPPPYFEGARAKDQPHFEPGIRLIRILRALSDAPDTPLDNIEAGLEKIARVTADYEYPSVQSIYEAWAQELGAVVDTDPIAAWRRDQCLARLSRPHAIERRNLANVVTHRIPIMLDSPDWPSQRMLITEDMWVDGGKLYGQIRNVESDLALAQWLLGGSPGGYVCPHAGSAAFCKDAIAQCRTGLPAIWNLPGASKCVIRRMLDKMGFELSRPL